MPRLFKPRETGARRPLSGVGWLCGLLALVFCAARASADARFNTEKLQFDPRTAALIEGVEQRRRAAAPRLDEPLPAISEGDRVREGSAAIEEALRATGVPAAGPRDVEREYREVLDAEVRALGEEARALDPAEEELDGELVPDPLDLAPRPRTVTHRSRAGLDDHQFRPTGPSAITTQLVFGEYRLLYDSQPAPKTRIQVDSSLFQSTARRSGIAYFDVDHRFNRRYSGSLGGTAIVERWADEFVLADSLLGSGFSNVVMHLPEQLDLSARYTFIRRALDRETSDTFSTRNHRAEFRVEKRVHGGTARFAYVDHQLDVPLDRASDLSHTIVLGGYTAPVLRKVDVDYAFIRTKEARNFDLGDTGDFVQTNNQLNILWRFSHAMNLSVDVDTEDRDYMIQDATFVSYRRTLLAPTFAVQQNAHLAYTFGYATEIYNHSAVRPELLFDSDELDFNRSRYSAGVSFQKKRVSALAAVAMSPTTYKRPGLLQSGNRVYTVSGTLVYDFDPALRATAAFTRVKQEFDVLDSDNVSESVTADLAYRY